MKVIKGEKGKLPYGTYDKKENRKKLLFTILTAFIAVIISLKLGELLNNVYISLLIVCPIEFLLLLFFVGGMNGLNVAMNIFFKDCNFKNFEVKMQYYMKNNLHSASRNELLMQYSNLLLSYDPERAFLMWNNVKRPIVNEFIYEFYEIQFIIASKEYDKAKELLNAYKLKYSKKQYQASSILLEYKLKILSTNDIIDDIESKLIYNKNNLYNKVVVLSYCMLYYDSRGFLDKAVHYANLIKDLNVHITLIDKQAEDVLKKEM